MMIVHNDPWIAHMPVQKPHVLSRSTLDTNIMLVHGDTGVSLTLNNWGTVIWNLIDGMQTAGEIIG